MQSTCAVAPLAAVVDAKMTEQLSILAQQWAEAPPAGQPARECSDMVLQLATTLESALATKLVGACAALGKSQATSTDLGLIVSRIFAIHLRVDKPIQQSTTRCLQSLLRKKEADIDLSSTVLQEYLGQDSCSSTGLLGMVAVLAMPFFKEVLAEVAVPWVSMLEQRCKLFSTIIEEDVEVTLKANILSFKAIKPEVLRGDLRQPVLAILANLLKLTESKDASREIVVFAATAAGFGWRALLDGGNCAQSVQRCWFAHDSNDDVEGIADLPRFQNPAGLPDRTKLALYRACLCCLPDDVLLSNLHPSGPINTTLLYSQIFPPLVDLAVEVAHHQTAYLGAQTLATWAETVARIAKKAPESVFCADVTDDSANVSVFPCISQSDVGELLLKSIFFLWEDSSEKIRHHGKSLLNAVLAIGQVHDEFAAAHGINTAKTVTQQIAKHALAMPQASKSRFSLLACLLPRLGAERLLELCPEFCSETIASMSILVLTQRGLEVYKAFCQVLRKTLKQEACLDAWAQHWLDLLLDSLSSDDEQTQASLCAYWLPSTFKIVPGSLFAIAQQLNQSEASLRSLMTLFSVARSQGLLGINAICDSLDTPLRIEGKALQLSYQTLLSGLLHSDEGISQAAFQLISRAHHKATPVEVDLFCQALPWHMNSSSSLHRQRVIAAMKHFLQRLQSGYFEACRELRKVEKLPLGDQPNTIAKCHTVQSDFIDFVTWLNELISASLFPGACFQRRLMALNLLSTQYQVWCSAKHPIDEPHVSLFTPDLFHQLQEALCDGHREVREIACSLLLQYYDSFATDSENTLSRCNTLLQAALRLLCKPHVQDTASGALLLKLFLRGYVGNSKLTFGDTEVIELAPSTDGSSAELMAFSFAILSRSLAAAKGDIIAAAKTAPTHGILLGIQTAIQYFADQKSISLSSLLGTLQPDQLIDLIDDVVRTSQSIMVNSRHSDDLPTYAEMDQSVTDHSKATSDADVNRHYVMSYAWLSLRHAAELMAIISKCLAKNMPSKFADRCAVHFRTILSTCRHRGVIETVAGAFTTFAQHTRKLQAFDELYDQWLKEEVDRVLDHKWSVTRRSAGLPFMIQALVRTKNSMFSTAVAPLLSLASETPKSNIEIEDPPQVHALNILRILLGDSLLTNEMQEHAGEACRVAILCFRSAIWGIRNGGLLLFTTVLNRIFGGRTSKDLDLTMASMTADVFFQRYSILKPFLEKQLGFLCTTDIPGSHQQLHPILTLLTQFHPSDELEGIDTDALLQHAWGLTANPSFVIRSLAAQSVVALLHPTQQEAALHRCFESIPDSAEKAHHNQTHGSLLLLRHLVESLQSSHLKWLGSVMAKKSWLGTKTNSCGVTRGSWLDLCYSILVKDTVAFEPIHEACTAHLYDLGKADSVTGQAFVSSALIRLYCRLLETCLQSSEFPTPSHLDEVFIACLTNGEQEVVTELLTVLLEMPESLASRLPEKMAAVTWVSLPRLKNRALCQAIRFVLHRSMATFPISFQSTQLPGGTISLADVIMLAHQGLTAKNLRVREASLELLGGLLHNCSPEEAEPVLESYQCRLRESCRYECAEVTRAAALRSVSLFASHRPRPHLEPVYWDVFSVLLLALQSEEAELRLQASVTVATIVKVDMVTPAQSLSNLADYIISYAKTDLDRGFNFLYQLMTPKTCAIVESEDVLFKTEPPNPFAEPIQMAQVSLQSLLALTTGSRNSALVQKDGKKLLDWGAVDDATVGYLVYEAEHRGGVAVQELVDALLLQQWSPQNVTTVYCMMARATWCAYALSLFGKRMQERGHVATFALLPKLPAVIEAWSVRCSEGGVPVVVQSALAFLIKACFAGDVRSFTEVTRQYAMMTAVLAASLVQVEHTDSLFPGADAALDDQTDINIPEESGEGVQQGGFQEEDDDIEDMQGSESHQLADPDALVPPTISSPFLLLGDLFLA